ALFDLARQGGTGGIGHPHFGAGGLAVGRGRLVHRTLQAGGGEHGQWLALASGAALGGEGQQYDRGHAQQGGQIGHGVPPSGVTAVHVGTGWPSCPPWPWHGVEAWPVLLLSGTTQCRVQYFGKARGAEAQLRFLYRQDRKSTRLNYSHVKRSY